MKTMLSLRLVAIASNVAFILYAAAGGLVPILALHGALLPMNIARLAQMRRQARLAEAAARTPAGAERFDWLAPFGNGRTLSAGTALFRKGDAADSMFVVIDGEVLLPEVGVTLGPGSVIGEIGLFSGRQRRTASAEAKGQVRVAELTERRVQDLYFDNPLFAYRLIRLVTRRLVDQLEKLEEKAGAEAAAAARAQDGGGGRRGDAGPAADGAERAGAVFPEAGERRSGRLDA